MRGPLHADQHAAHLTCLGRPGLHQIINGLPAAEVQVADTEIGSLRHGQRGAQCAQQVLINVVEDPGHLPPVFVGIVHSVKVSESPWIGPQGPGNPSAKLSAEGAIAQSFCVCRIRVTTLSCFASGFASDDEGALPTAKPAVGLRRGRSIQPTAWHRGGWTTWQDSG